MPDGSSPARWRVAVITWLAICPLITVLLPLLAPLVEPVPPVLRPVPMTLVLVPLMTYVVMPTMTRVFRRFLGVPATASSRRPPARPTDT